MTRLRRHARGFTLIELMITLVIGTTITGTGLTLYLQMSKSRNLVQAELSLQENSYYVTQTFKQLVNQAGFRPLNTALMPDPFIPISTPDNAFVEVAGSWELGEFVSVQSDGLAIRFDGSSNDLGVADDSIINCQGTSIAVGDVSDVVFTVVDGELLCTSAGETTELIVESDGIKVEDIAIYWGLDTNNDGSVDEFVSAANGVTASETLLGLRVNLLFSSRDEVMRNDLGYVFDGVEYDAPDSRLRRETITTVQIKN